MAGTGDPLSGALVIRGGQNQDVDAIYARLQEDEARTVEPVALSVRVEWQSRTEAAASTIERAAKSPPPLAHGQVQVAVAEFVAAVGVQLVHSVEPGEAQNHHNAVFDRPVTWAQVSNFVRCFDKPIPNPAKGKRPKRAKA